ncbi:GIY-YIG nuclease family protein [Clostridium beijerinckii]|uniref:GIY-YIG nuclease family protein n=1 Tax=Clostridium beijerinckii TaxID=1520 RepID=UPI00156DCEC9|nr:GIY-YIG nuclease family protein [Clostridium beijerinckii]NRU52445.1 hypothetical protein [Clostridium beijerinckii]NYC69110.1 hypothetical protein [Clostridium beijerinckii]NYC91929.1 hypothetical protein [Clostridium beijerinckii]
MPNHFGLKVIEGKYGLEITREKYAIINTKSSFQGTMVGCDYANEKECIYTNEWCENHQKECLENYDLNMEYFSLLNNEEFNKELNGFLDKNKCFQEVFDLNLYNMKSGYYIMVLDKYSQLYIGTAKYIKKRIRQHWSGNKYFDRLLFPMGAVNTSKLSIDSFRALDTTRIFVYETDRIFEKEDNFINQFSNKYLCNRLGGGKIEGGLLQIITMMKNRKLK